MILSCGHTYCNVCITRFCTKNTMTCPNDKQTVKSSDQINMMLYNALPESTGNQKEEEGETILCPNNHPMEFKEVNSSQKCVKCKKNSNEIIKCTKCDYLSCMKCIDISNVGRKCPAGHIVQFKKLNSSKKCFKCAKNSTYVMSCTKCEFLICNKCRAPKYEPPQCVCGNSYECKRLNSSNNCFVCTKNFTEILGCFKCELHLCMGCSGINFNSFSCPAHMKIEFKELNSSQQCFKCRKNVNQCEKCPSCSFLICVNCSGLMGVSPKGTCFCGGEIDYKKLNSSIKCFKCQKNTTEGNKCKSCALWVCSKCL